MMPDVFAPSYVDRVRDTPELRRVLALPRRNLSEEEWAEIHRELEEVLRAPGGEMSLRPIQVKALYDLGTAGGLFAPLRVGAGKTIISFLSATVTFSTRPLLLVPAKLLEKTQRELVVCRAHWDIVPPRIMTYEWLGRVQGADALERYQPDLIVADECHKLKNLKAAVSRRVNRWFKSNSGATKCVAMSGTITKRSLHDYAHILQWVYGPKSYPLPVKYPERDTWACAIDGRKRQQYADPGALRLFCDKEEEKLWRWDSQRAARKAYRRHLVNTPGVIATDETPIDASLVVTSLEATVSKKVDEAFRVLRTDWETPDGWPLADGLEMFRHSRELALGFFYKWDPRPERAWLDPRKEWCSFVRSKIGSSNKYDSELQVRMAFADHPLLAAWQAVKDTFVPNTVPVWIDHFLVDVVEKWAKTNRGIIWAEHRCVGELLEKELGITYYGRRGMSSAGRVIEDHPPGKPLIASQQSNAEGRNLQAWSRNLILSMPPNGLQSEQLLGRTHRDGQEADEVSVDVLMTCSEHVSAFRQAKKDAEYVEDSTGSPQKLLLADVSVLTTQDIAGRQSARWAT